MQVWLKGTVRSDEANAARDMLGPLALASLVLLWQIKSFIKWNEFVYITAAVNRVFPP